MAITNNRSIRTDFDIAQFAHDKLLPRMRSFREDSDCIAFADCYRRRY